MPRLTKRSVEAFAPAARAVVWYDDKLAGFGVRVMPSGKRVYFARYRNRHGTHRWHKIGEHGTVTAEAARIAAQRILQDVTLNGRDPSAERDALRVAPTVSDLLDRYIKEHLERRNSPRTIELNKAIVERDIRPQFGKLKVAAVTCHDIHKFHAARYSTPRQANLIVAVCSKVFNLAELWEMRPEGSNPCRRIERYPENHRERFLSGEELSRLGGTLREAETIGLPRKNGDRTLYRRVTTATIELLLYTGCRLSEILNLKWEQVDFREGQITLLMTKSGRLQRVTMNPQARQVFKELESLKTSECVLPSISSARQPISKAGIEAAWTKLRAAARLDDVRLHDLRHTVGTYAAQTGANAFHIRDLLRHENLAMTGRYVSRADEPVRTLSDLVGERISAAMAGKPLAAVVGLNVGKS